MTRIHDTTPAMPLPGSNAGRRSSARRFLATLLAALVLFAGRIDVSVAQPRDFNRTIGETVIDRGSTHYRFEQFTQVSPDGQKRWRVRLGIPLAPPADRPRPGIWMLDGNAALAEFDEALLAELAQHNAPVLVFLGYDNELRIDSLQRSRDYTPGPVTAGEDGPRGRRPSGGADAFLEAIERDLKPDVARRVALAPDAQLLWGHSYGGLFVLHALANRPMLFRTYAAASPSLWWGNGLMLQTFDERGTLAADPPRHVWFLLGGIERQGQIDPDSNASGRRRFIDQAIDLPRDATVGLANRLSGQPGLSVRYREFDGLGHGPMFRASLLATLHAFSGVTDRSQAPRPGTEAPTTSR